VAFAIKRKGNGRREREVNLDPFHRNTERTSPWIPVDVVHSHRIV
jgi:hypothetical protein